MASVWKALPLSDRRFIAAMLVFRIATRIRGAHYEWLPPDLEKRLKRCSRETLFSIVAECVALITRAPVVRRVKETHRRKRRRGGETK